MSDTTDRETYAPLIFFPYDDDTGRWCLMLTDAAMVQHAALFERHGTLSHGYAWNGVAKTALRVHEIASDDVGFDPEAGMFVAFGTDVAALRRLGEVLRDAFHDEAKLEALVDATSIDDMD